ncbi:phosphoribosylformylglycinamidine cyclo-ligase [bacterium B17]|nr:phosphoribosylformylglycinamidine cyclo-ligase [bacterium B17]
MSKKKKSSYAEAGVDIDEMMTSLSAVKRMVKTTATKGVLNNIGSFGGLFKSPGKDHVLVASADGVGTKLKVAEMAGKHDTIGQDLINHCTNDILVQGARPLFFLDYLGTSKLQAKAFKEVVKGLCKACRENDCALLGGETAEMPGLYPEGEYDLVGTIVGTAEKSKIITGAKIKPGNVIIGLHCTGLQTNGFSLARKVIFEKAKLKINDTFPGTKKTVAAILLDVHRSFLKPVSKVMDKISIRGMAHITGGGVIDNIPRILPDNCQVIINKGSWPIPKVFSFIQEKGGIDEDEMYRVFNMGVGFVLIVSKKDAATACEILKKARCKHSIIGKIAKGKRSVLLQE